MDKIILLIALILFVNLGTLLCLVVVIVRLNNPINPVFTPKDFKEIVKKMKVNTIIRDL